MTRMRPFTRTRFVIMDTELRFRPMADLPSGIIYLLRNDRELAVGASAGSLTGSGSRCSRRRCMTVAVVFNSFLRWRRCSRSSNREGIASISSPSLNGFKELVQWGILCLRGQAVIRKGWCWMREFIVCIRDIWINREIKGWIIHFMTERNYN